MRAVDNRYFNIFAHPTGHLLGERTAYPINLELILRTANERSCAIELNAHPTRLDIPLFLLRPLSQPWQDTLAQDPKYVSVAI